MQAWLDGHSLLLVHSGLQYGGDPENSGIHVHDGVPDISLHMELGPQGDGVQGDTSAVGGSEKTTNYYFACVNVNYFSK